MQQFIVAVPPKEYQNRILEFQRVWPRNTIPALVEPHVTVKAQGGLTSDREWLEDVRHVAAGFKPFEIKLGPPSFFGEEVLFLTVHSDRIRDLHRALVTAVSPAPEMIEQYFENDAYHPHLTLAARSSGLTLDELTAMRDQAAHHLSPYPTFPVEFVRVLEHGGPGSVSRKLVDLPLGTS